MHTVTPVPSAWTAPGAGTTGSSLPGAPHGPVPWSRRWATTARAAAERPPPVGASRRRCTKARLAARRPSAKPVDVAGSRHVSRSVPASRPGDERVQSRRKVSRLEMAPPLCTGRAAHDRPEVSRTQAEVPSANKERGPVGHGVDGVGHTALAVALEERGHDVEGVLRRGGALEAEADEVHAEQGGGRQGGVVDGVDHLVADGDAVLVDAVLRTPQPRRARQHGGGGTDVGDLQILRVQRAPRPPSDMERTTWASVTGRSEFLAKRVPWSERTHRVSHTAERDRSGGALVGLPGGQVGETGVVGEDLDDRSPQAEALLDPLDVEDLVPQHQGGDTPEPPARAVRPERCR